MFPTRVVGCGPSFLAGQTTGRNCAGGSDPSHSGDRPDGTASNQRHQAFAHYRNTYPANTLCTV